MKQYSGLAKLFRRRQYVIDRPMQYGAAAQLLIGFGMIGLLFVVGMFVFLGDNAMAGMNLMVIREFLLMANAVYFVLAAVILSVLVLLLTHRFAGPAYVMDLAIQGMLNGDYNRRLALRKRDYLRNLAGGLDDLRARWMQHDTETQAAVEELHLCLEQQRYEDAEKFVAVLRSMRLVKPRSNASEATGDEDVARARREKESVAV